MCAIDWAALGTWAAVVLALGFFVFDKVDRRARERAEAKIIALLLSTELSVLATRTRGLVHEIDDERSGGLIDAILAMDAHNRVRVADIASDFPTGTLESVIGRIHVLPAAASTALMLLLSSVRELRLAAEKLREMTGGDARDDIDGFMPHFRVDAAAAAERAAAAVAACEAAARR